MAFLRRALVVLAGLACGMAAAFVFLPIAAMADPAMREVGAIVALLAFLGVLIGAFHDMVTQGFAILAFLLYMMAIIVAAAPLTIAALIGEAARLRSLVWYGGASGALAAVLPFAIRFDEVVPAREGAHVPATRLALVFFLTGAVAGLVYWAVAGRGRAPKV